MTDADVDYHIVSDVSRETSDMVAVNAEFDRDYMIAIAGYIGSERVVEFIIGMTEHSVIVFALRKLAPSPHDITFDAVCFLHTLYITMGRQRIVFMCRSDAHRRLFKKYIRRLGYGLKE